MAGFAAVALAGFTLHLAAGFSGLIQPTPPTPSAQRAYEASRPAVGLIQVDTTLHAAVAEPTLSTAGLRLLATRTASGADAASNLDAILADPAANLVAGLGSVSEDFYLRNSGTGFFVSEDGRMVTASHVVAPLATDLADQMRKNFDDPTFIGGADHDLLRTLVAGTPGFKPGAAAQAAINAWLAGYLKQNAVLGSNQEQIAIGYGTATVSDRLMSSGDHAEVLAAEAPYPGKDVAIIKVGVVGAVPALAVSPEARPAQGETANLIGYGPTLFSADNGVEPPSETRLEAGTVQSYEDHPGFTAYATDAVSRPGDSGGPILDESGQVVGMLSYSDKNDSGQSLYGANFFIPASVIRQLMATQKVRPPSSLTGITGAYYRALASTDQEHYRDAVALLEPIHARAPEDLEARAALEADRAAIAAGLDRTPFRVPWSQVGLWIGLLAAAFEWTLALLPVRLSTGPVAQQGGGQVEPGALLVGDRPRQ